MPGMFSRPHPIPYETTKNIPKMNDWFPFVKWNWNLYLRFGRRGIHHSHEWEASTGHPSHRDNCPYLGLLLIKKSVTKCCIAFNKNNISNLPPAANPAHNTLLPNWLSPLYSLINLYFSLQMWLLITGSWTWCKIGERLPKIPSAVFPHPDEIIYTLLKWDLISNHTRLMQANRVAVWRKKIDRKTK